MTGLAAGTLLYVAFFEIFASEGKHLKIKSLHILVAVLGFILMASLELIGGHSHAGHGHGGHSSSLQNGSANEHSHHGHDHDHHPPSLHSHSSEEEGHHDHVH